MGNIRPSGKRRVSHFTARNIRENRQLRVFTNRLLNKIKSLGGFIFYVGTRKTDLPEDHHSSQLHKATLTEAIKRLNQFCAEDCEPPESFVLVLDQHSLESELLTKAAQSVYDRKNPKRHLIDLPFRVESHRYQTMQAADWIAALVGCFGAFWADPTTYSEHHVFCRYFASRLEQASSPRSGMRGVARALGSRDTGISTPQATSSSPFKRYGPRSTARAAGA